MLCHCFEYVHENIDRIIKYFEEGNADIPTLLLRKRGQQKACNLYMLGDRWEERVFLHALLGLTSALPLLKITAQKVEWN